MTYILNIDNHYHYLHHHDCDEHNHAVELIIKDHHVSSRSPFIIFMMIMNSIMIKMIRIMSVMSIVMSMVQVTMHKDRFHSKTSWSEDARSSFKSLSLHL